MDGDSTILGWSYFLPRLLAVAALVLTNGFFVSVEFALVAARRPRLEKMAQEGHRLASLVLSMMDQVDLYIAASQLGITIASLALGWVGDVTVAALIEPSLQMWIGRLLGTVSAHIIGTVLSFSTITFMHIVLGEQVPKVFTIRNPEDVALFIARPMQLFTTLFHPFIWLLDRSTAGVLRVLGVPPVSGHRHAYTLEELKLLLQQSEEEGILHEDGVEMASRALEFSRRMVREVMIPRTEIIGVEENTTVQDVLELFKEHRHARFPVYRGDLDHIVGILSMKDILALLADNPDIRKKTLKELQEIGLIKPVFAVPETRGLGDLFQEMRDKHVRMAVVIDEYGGTAGLVTLDEISEEILGRITDEWVREEPDIQPVDEQTFDINAQLRVDEVNDELHTSIPESDLYETVAGFILYLLGRIPQEGDEVRWDGLLFRVTQMKGPKIERVHLILLNGRSSEEAALPPSPEASSEHPTAPGVFSHSHEKEVSVGSRHPR